MGGTYARDGQTGRVDVFRRVARVAGTSITAVALLVAFGATPAAAHAEVRESDPPRDGETGVGTDQIEMSFIEIDPAGPVSVLVLDPAGKDRVDGEIDVEGDTVTVPVQPLEAGEHRVTWSVLSADGDGISEGTFVFQVVDSGGSGFGVWLLWIVALGIPAAIFLRPGARKKSS